MEFKGVLIGKCTGKGLCEGNGCLLLFLRQESFMGYLRGDGDFVVFKSEYN